MKMKQKIIDMKTANPSFGYDKLAKALGVHRNVIRYHLAPLYRAGALPYVIEPKKRSSRYTKENAVLDMGGKCSKCGYDKCLAALEFHHLDPSAKEFSVSKAMSNWKSTKKIKKELSNCILVCANCHREIHNLA